MSEKRGPGRPPKEEKPKEERPEAAEEQVESLGRVHKRDYKLFFGPHDKGAAKPAFCYPQRIDNLREEVRKMERNLEMGFVSPERKMAYEMRLKERKTRLESIEAATDAARKVVEKDKDWWVQRRKELGEEIAASMPSRNDIRKRIVNPYRVAKMEKEGGLGEKKKEFIIISRILGEESNISFLQRD